MTNGLKPYPEYKDSGLPWLGNIPAHWEVRASKRMFSESGERARPDDEQLSATQAYGVILQSDYEARVGRKVVRIINHLEKRKHVEPDDFVISMRSFQGGLERAFARGAIRSSYVVLKSGDMVHVPYFAHLFKSHPYIQALRATSEFIRDGQDLTFANFSRVPLPVVPKDEQKAIADYLDANAVKVRRFIRNRRRLIEVLNEQKQALINRAVTRGLDPHVRLKPSGIDYLGDIPEHWEVRRLRNLVELRVSNVDKHSKDGEVPVRLCNYTDVYRNPVITADMPFMRATATREEIEAFRLQVGDVIITKDSEEWQDIGVPAVVAETAGDLVCGYHLAILRPKLRAATGSSIDSQIKKQRWYEGRKGDKGYRYVPLEKAGAHDGYFRWYFDDVAARFDEVINIFRTAKTEQCEIVATLYAAWEDLLAQGKATDDQVIEQVLHNWHPSKQKINEARWRRALKWMKEKGLTPGV